MYTNQFGTFYTSLVDSIRLMVDLKFSGSAFVYPCFSTIQVLQREMQHG